MQFSKPAQRWAVHATVVAVMIGGVGAFLGLDKTVHLTVDGRTEKVHTFARSVADVLAREGIAVGRHDSVVPALDRGIADGQRIAVRFGRPIDLERDGRTRRVWVTATNVAEALAQLDLRDRDVVVSASRSAPIGREGLTLSVLSPRQMLLIVDGKTRRITTAAATVGQVLLEAGIRLDARDEVRPILAGTPVEGSRIRVVRVEAKRITVKLEIPFKIRKVSDPKMFPWERKVVTAGRKGVKAVTVDLIRRDGKPAGRDSVSTRVLRKPVTKVVRVGTKATRFARTGVERLNWVALAACETRGNLRATSRYGHYGLYQFTVSTWRSVGGRGMPHRASAAEQTYRAKLLYQREGSRPWPGCGRHLFRR